MGNLRLKHFDTHVRTAVLLGACALIVNLAQHFFYPASEIAVGNIFLFWTAAALGPHYTAIAVAFGSFPQALLLTGDYVYAVRILIMCLAISYILRARPRVPAYLVVSGIWVVFFFPALTYLNKAGLTVVGHSGQALMTIGFGETMLALLSGILFLNHGIWNGVAARPRHIGLRYFLDHVLPAAVLISLFAVLSLGPGKQFFIESPAPAHSTFLIAAILIVGLLLSVGGSAWLSFLIERDASQLLSKNFLKDQRGKTFSGLSSDFWRRQNRSVEPEFSPRSSSSHSSHDEEMNSFLPPHQGICALSRNGTIAFLNRKFKQVAEIADNDPLGKRLNSISMNEAVKKAISELLERTLTIGPRTIELKLNQLPDKLRFLELSSQLAETFPTATLGNESDSIIVALRVKGIAHAFNNSLAAIVGQASSGKHASNEEVVDQTYDSILTACRKAGGLVRQLLQFIEEQPLLLKKGDLGEFLSEHLELLNKLVGENIEVEFVKPASPTGGSYDPNLMLQAISNLVINSKEAIGEKEGKIVITLDTEQLETEVADLIPGGRPGAFCRLRIKDTGQGMNREILARAFEPLFTTKSGNGNAGFGLSIVYGIMRSIDGFLTMESQPGKGTTVSLYLPQVELSDDSAAVTKSIDDEKPPQAPATGNQEKILVVEDDHNVREVVSSMLESLGYRVTSCSNGFEAIERCKQDSYDLVLADMIMPRMNGVELVTKLKEIHEEAKTLIMTAYGVKEESVDIPILPKPFDMDTLAEVVKGSLTKGRNGEQERESTGQ